MNLHQHRHSTRSKRLGVAAVELALTIVPLLIAAFGVSEYGRMMFTFNALDKSVRDAVRYAIAPPSDSTDLLGEVRNIAVFGNVDGSGARLAPRLQTTMVDLATTTEDTAYGNIRFMTVTITGYQYTSIVTYVAPGRVPFNTISATMRN